MDTHCLSAGMVQAYAAYLRREERAAQTVRKYLHDVTCFCAFCGRDPVTKESVIHFKSVLLAQHSAVSVNSMLVAVNGFLAFLGWHECRVRLLRIQRSPYRDPRRQLTREEYYRLVNCAEQRRDRRLSLLVQTLCSTGIRVSELRCITVAALHLGRASVMNKGKKRTVYLPRALCARLKSYCAARRIRSGAVFVTRSGRPLDRSNIWCMMKALARHAGVRAEKVFPHNLRHLFAECYYRQKKDLDHLACILGHSSIDTTRLYIRTSGEQHRRELDQLRLLL